MALRAVSESEAQEAAAPDVAELMREAMVACRKAADAMYEQRHPARILQGALGSAAAALELHTRRGAV